MVNKELTALLSEYHLHQGNETIRIALHDCIVSLYVANKISRAEYHNAMGYL